MPHEPDAPDSVFLADFPAESADWRDEKLDEHWQRLLQIRSDVQRALERARAPEGDEEPIIGSSQQAELTVFAEGSTLKLLREYEDRLQTLFIVSDVELVEGQPSGDATVRCEVEASDADKCPRCWNYWVDPKSDDEICARCTEVIEGLDQ